MTFQNKETKSSDKQMCDMILIKRDDLKVLGSHSYVDKFSRKRDYENL